MIACPNCGGNVKFDIASQQLSCEYCHGYFDPYQFDSKTSDGIEEQDFEATIFTCPQCGGEIYSTDNTAAGFCSFCGASTILFSRLTKQRKPNFIIPFKKTKEDCKNAYSKMMKHALFAPDELKNPKNIDSFRGIYMPYWAYHFTQKGDITLPGEKSHRRGDYIITDHYRMTGYLDAFYKGLSYDASSSFADNISEAVAPYDVKGMKKFTPGYLSGFYADTPDVAPSIYQKEAEQIAFDNTMKEIEKVPQFAGYHLNTTAISGSPAAINSKLETVDSAMFPVWFMSYRNKDRIAYATVNGQTGKVVVDLPISTKKYAIGSLLLAIPIFLILLLFVNLIPAKLLVLSAVIAIISALIYTIELGKIAKKESNEADLGLLYRNNPDVAKNESAKKKNTSLKKNLGKKKSASSIIGMIVLIYVIIAFGSVLLPILTTLSSSSAISWGIISIAMVVIFCFGKSKMDAIPGKESIIGYIATGIAVILSAVVGLLHPVYDYWYYGGAILNLIAVFLNIRDIINYYNVLSTRRLPQFDHKGGDDRA